tara:strand:- start:18360 stop:19340 length:981 start_codon:yes stop_codon:yes gene_type:complete
MGPGFGGINIGNFALPNIDLEDINAGIASQVAKYLAEQDLSNSTNEFEKDVAENVIDQITDFESGIGSLPPVVEQVLGTMMPQDKAIEAVSDRDFPTFAEPTAPDLIDFKETITQALPVETSPAVTTPAVTTPAVTTPAAAPIAFNTPTLTNEELAAGLLGLLNSDDERAIGRANELDLPIIGGVGSLPSTGRDNIPAYDPNQPPGVFSPPVRLPDVSGRPAPINSPISNLITQQRQAYNSALQNAVYNPAPPQQQTTFVRPMSAAEFGSRPGEEPQTNLGFMSMRGGGAMKLPNSPMNMGLAGLPPMQQNDKLTQLFAQSFRPRR